jgi:hypothetical protein
VQLPPLKRLGAWNQTHKHKSTQTQKHTNTLTLIIKGLSVEDAAQLANVVREMAEKDPTQNYLCVIQGLEAKPLEEAKRILREIFPPGGMAS